MGRGSAVAHHGIAASPRPAVLPHTSTRLATKCMLSAGCPHWGCQLGEAYSAPASPWWTHCSLGLLDTTGFDAAKGINNKSRQADTTLTLGLSAEGRFSASIAAFAQWWDGSLSLSCDVRPPTKSVYLPLAIAPTPSPVPTATLQLVHAAGGERRAPAGRRWRGVRESAAGLADGWSGS
jgi:hypothetical protein